MTRDERRAKMVADIGEERVKRVEAIFEEFKREMNTTRLATDGPHARIPFP